MTLFIFEFHGFPIFFVSKANNEKFIHLNDIVARTTCRTFPKKGFFVESTEDKIGLARD